MHSGDYRDFAEILFSCRQCSAVAELYVKMRQEQASGRGNTFFR
jgi:hypothetical protein